jgi:glycosyltransferase involved in cell wall biosynthesis
MRIGIDARTFNKHKTGMGVERLLRNLLENWLKIYPQHEYLLISDEELFIPNSLSSAANIKVIVRPGLRKGLLWTYWTLPRVLAEYKADVLLSPAYYTALFTPGIPKVVMIHDISYRAIKEEYPRKQGMVFNLMSYLSCVFANKIATISHYSQSEIEKYYRPARGKVVTIYLGLEEHFKPRQSGQLKEGHPFFLYVGTMYKRRHVQELLDAYERLPDGEKTPDLVLVGANKIHPIYDVAARVKEINTNNKNRTIYHSETVDESKLISLYQNCLAFYYLSSYEGFGFPPLEAMACGAPVVTARSTSIPEVVGDNALFVDPESIQEISASMSLMINDEKRRELLARAGIDRAARFNWHNSAVAYMKLLEDAVKR